MNANRARKIAERRNNPKRLIRRINQDIKIAANAGYDCTAKTYTEPLPEEVLSYFYHKGYTVTSTENNNKNSDWRMYYIFSWG